MTFAQAHQSEVARPGGNPSATMAPPVLVVGDDGEDSEHIGWLLRISGYHAVIVPDVASAKMFLDQHRPLLVVTNVRRPGAGQADPLAQLLAHVRATCPETMVLIISGDVVDASTEVKSGVAGALPRPLDAGKFCSAVNRIMNRYGPTRAG